MDSVDYARSEEQRNADICNEHRAKLGLKPSTLEEDCDKELCSKGCPLRPKTKPKILSVAMWLGISQEEFSAKVNYGTCIKCKKPARSQASCLCSGHAGAFHRWQKRMRKQEMKQ